METIREISKIVWYLASIGIGSIFAIVFGMVAIELIVVIIQKLRGKK